ncbi:MAG: Mur ligase domain-containing protein, partial [Sediminibacterium sp.]
MTKLQDILYRVHLKQVHGSTDITVSGIQIDSRKLEAGNVFVAIRGVVSDGHEYIDKAIANGASVIVCDTMPARFEDG